MRTTLFILSGLLITGAATTAQAESHIYVAKTVKIAETAGVPAKVKTECGNLGYDLPVSLSKKHSAIKLVKSTKGKAKVLEIEIVDVVAKAGSLFSGPKKITVSGKLRSGKKVLGSFTATRSSMMASFSTCELLAKVEQTLGKDIAIWLRNPTKGAKL